MSELDEKLENIREIFESLKRQILSLDDKIGDLEYSMKTTYDCSFDKEGKLTIKESK